jgi:Domain of unknown function (DUF4386)
MTISTLDESQRQAARVVGFTYLFAMVTAVFAEMFVRGQLIVPDNAVETAQNIIAHERLWRLGIASYLICLLADVALITALYVILKRVNQNLALFAAFLRVVETAIGVAATLNSFDVLRFLSGANYLQALRTDQLQALARIPISVYGAGINVSFVFLGFGSAVFGYLWFKSNYIPRALAALGVFGSLLLAAGSFAIIIFPNLAKILSLGYMLPLGVFEITMGFWLLVKGLRPSAIAEPDKVNG